MKNYIGNTIVAPATIPGTGAITVIRVSGTNTFDIIDKTVDFLHGTASESKGYKIKFGTVKTADGDALDEVLVSIFRAPNSYTGEDSAEISCHASSYIANTLIELLVQNGATIAHPGEFTQRAFINGKMDLAEAEAVADVIAAEGEAAHKIAFNQMKGGFSNELKDMRTSLLNITSLMELELDFSEEEVEFADRTQLNTLVKDVISHLNKLISSFKLGNAIKNGIPTAIAGAANTGKSTLLNALLQEDRAIVSNIAGTTRDTIEETLNIDGVLFRFIDTAGIRQTDETIEKIGIEKTYEMISKASVILGLLNCENNLEEIENEMKLMLSKVDLNEQKLIFLLNKIDITENSENTTIPSDNIAEGADSSTSASGNVLVQAAFDEKKSKNNIFKSGNNIVNSLNTFVSSIDNNDVPNLTERVDIIPISAKEGLGLDVLRDKLVSFKDELHVNQSAVMVTNARHLEALKQTRTSLSNVLNALALGIPTDLVAQDLREGIFHLGSITGEISTDEILGNIFKNFCIGK